MEIGSPFCSRAKAKREIIWLINKSMMMRREDERISWGSRDANEKMRGRTRTVCTELQSVSKIVALLPLSTAVILSHPPMRTRTSTGANVSPRGMLTLGLYDRETFIEWKEILTHTEPGENGIIIMPQSLAVRGWDTSAKKASLISLSPANQWYCSVLFCACDL